MHVCGKCGAKLTGVGPAGLCPRCFLQEGLNPEPGHGPPPAGDNEALQYLAQPNPSAPEASGATLKLNLADTEDEALGTRISHYKLLERVGEGGCGVVYVAEQIEPVRRRVALKVIKLGMDTKQVVARFEAERQALAMMDHPNIAKVLDAGTTETGRPYFVMELVRGIPVTDYCDQNNLPTHERLELFIKVCHAIQHAHQKGIIHRDLKPSNILVTLHDGVPVPKVIDFGIAKATEGRLTDATIYTQLHQFIGTPAYMSPEQAEMSGLDIDTRSDIYSLGVLLYELLAGSTPFDAKELMSQGIDAMRKTIREKEPPRPSTRLATLKGQKLTTTVKRRSVEAPKLIQLLRGDLDWIVMKCLEKDRTRRYETANALAADLTRHLTHEPVLARPPSRVYHFQKSVRRNRLAWSAAAAVVGTLALGLAGIVWQWRRADRNAAREMQQRLRVEATVVRLEMEQADTLLAQDQTAVAVARVARLLRRHPDNHVIAERLLAALSVLDLKSSPTDSLTNLANLDSMVLNRGQPLALDFAHSDKATAAGTWAGLSPDGQRVLTAAGLAVRLWDAQTGQPISKPMLHRDAVRIAHFSPDGSHVVTASADASACVWDARTGAALTPPLQHGDRILDVRFSPDGSRIVTASADGTARLWNARSGQPIGAVLQHRQDSNESLEGNEYALEFGESGETEPSDVLLACFSSDGQRVVTACQDGGVRIWDAITGRLTAGPMAHTSPVSHVRFGPDSRHLATVSAEGEGRLWDTQTGKLLTGLASPLLGTANDSPGLSPDGQRIVTLSRNTAQVRDVRSGQPVGNPMVHAARLVTARFSPDGTHVVLGAADGTARIWDVETALPVSELLPHGGEVQHAEFSGDGHWLLTAAADGKARLWEVPHAPAPIPRWLPDLAEAVVQQRLTENNAREPVSHEQLESLRQKRIADAGTDFYTRWGRWFFAPAVGRTLSPASPMTVSRYVDHLLGEDTVESLRLAVRLAPSNAVASARLSAASLLARIQSLVGSNKRAEALVLVEEALVRHPEQAEFWQFKGALLDVASRWDEANQAYSQARKLAGDDQHLAVWYRRSSEQLSIWTSRRVAASRAALTNLLEMAYPTASECRAAAWQGAYRALLEGQTYHGLEDMWKLDQLLMLAERAVELDPTDWRNLQFLGMAQYRNQQFASAARTFRAEARARGGTPSVRSLFFLAMTHQKLGEPKQARECFAKARQWWQAIFPRLPSSHQAGFVPLRLETEQALWPGLPKAGWKVVSASYEGKGETAGSASRAIDENPATFWHTWENDAGRASPQEIVVDLGERLDLAGFYYLPRQDGSLSMADQFEFLLSLDGQNWPAPVARGTFPNLKEYPVQQTVLFEKPVTARFFRFVATHAVEGNHLSVAELGVIADPARADQMWALNARGKVLAESNRLDRALAAFEESIALAGTDTNTCEQALTEARLNRAALLRRLNRLTEASIENCLARGIPLRDTQARPGLIDLSQFYNAALTRDMHEIEIRPGIRNHLAALRPVVQELGPVEFDVRGLINLSGTFLSRSRMVRFPAAVTGIPLPRKVARLHFLHGTVWPVPNGTPVGRYVLRFLDGQEQVFPIVYGVDVRDWCRLQTEDGRGERLHVVWQGMNPAAILNGAILQLTRSTFENPRLEAEVASLDFVSAMSDSAPFLIAVTVE